MRPNPSDTPVQISPFPIEVTEKYRRENKFFHRFMPRVHLELSPNQVCKVDPETLARTVYTPQEAFSSDRLLIAWVKPAAACLAQAISRGRLVQLRPFLQLQDMEHLEAEISDAEYWILEQVGLRAGGSGVAILDKTGTRVTRSLEP